MGRINNNIAMIRPSFFEDGQEYLRRYQGKSTDETIFVYVDFITYSHYPPFIIVRNRITGHRELCPRDDLFSLM